MNRSRRTREHRRPSGRSSRSALLEHSDEQLVELVLAGDDAAFEVLFDRHVADSLWYAREVLGSWGEAEEAVRHSFAAAHAYLETRGQEIEFLPWLHTILGNYCLSILQARPSGPARAEDDATVVDLGEWRLRRKLLGVAFPFAPSSGLRDAAMAACGIGAGAAGAGAPLVGGTLAKLAMVAVLAAGGVGVAGNVASDRAASADPGGPPPAVRTLARAGERPAAWLRPLHGSAVRRHSLIGATVREVTRAAREGLPAPRRVPAERSPHEPTTPLDPGESALPAPAATVPVSAEAPAPPVESTLRQVADVVEVDVVVIDAVEIEAPEPEPEPSPEAQPPPSPDLPQIAEDLGVPAVTPPVDVQALLSQETDVVLN